MNEEEREGDLWRLRRDQADVQVKRNRQVSSTKGEERKKEPQGVTCSGGRKLGLAIHIPRGQLRYGWLWTRLTET